MRFQTRVFKKLTSEPVEVQDINNQIVEIHHMDTEELKKEFADRARFALWSSDGTKYKILIEQGYHEAMKPLYSKDANEIWLDYLNTFNKRQKKLSVIFLSSSLAVLVIGTILSIALSKIMEGSIYFLLGAVILSFLSSMFQNTQVKKVADQESKNLQNRLINLFGEEKYNDLALVQQQYYNTYFKVEEKEASDEASLEENIQGTEEFKEDEVAETNDEEQNNE